jgi:hypothetical protein
MQLWIERQNGDGQSRKCSPFPFNFYVLVHSGAEEVKLIATASFLVGIQVVEDKSVALNVRAALPEDFTLGVELPNQITTPIVAAENRPRQLPLGTTYGL